MSTSRSAKEIRDYLITELSKLLEVEPAAIDPAAPLDELGVDSLMALGMAGGLAGWLGRDVPVTLMWDYRSVLAISDALTTSELPKPLPAGVVALQSSGSCVPIFGFPGLAGTPLAFAAMASQVDKDQPFYGVAVPGFEGVPGSYESVEEIAAAMLAMIRQVQPKGPYRLAGYCFGGLLAYEAARQLVATGEEVSLLAIYDAFTTKGRSPLPRWKRLFVHLRLLALDRSHLKQVAGKAWGAILLGNLNKAKPEYWIEEVPPEFVAGAQLWNINSIAAAKYQPKSYDGPIIWFQATDRAKYNAFYRMMSCGGWSCCTTGAVTTVKLPGNHGDLIGLAHALTAAQALRPFLTES